MTRFYLVDKYKSLVGGRGFLGLANATVDPRCANSFLADLATRGTAISF